MPRGNNKSLVSITDREKEEKRKKREAQTPVESVSKAAAKKKKEFEPKGVQICISKVRDEYIGQTSIASMSLKAAHRTLEVVVYTKQPDSEEWVAYRKVTGANDAHLQRKINEITKEIIEKSGYLV